MTAQDLASSGAAFSAASWQTQLHGASGRCQVEPRDQSWIKKAAGAIRMPNDDHSAPAWANADVLWMRNLDGFTRVGHSNLERLKRLCFRQALDFFDTHRQHHAIELFA